MGLLGDVAQFVGKNKSNAKPGMSGIGALPNELKDPLYSYAQQLMPLYGDLNKQLNPQDFLAGISPEYQNVLNQLGLGVNDSIDPYMNQYLGGIFDLIDRETGSNIANYNADAARSGDLGGFYSSSKQNAQNALQEAGMRQKTLAQFGAVDKAREYRNQLLQQQLGANEFQRQFQQQQMDLNNPYLRAQMYQQALNPILSAAGSASIGAQEAKPGTLQKVGAGLNAFGPAVGNLLGGIFGGF